MDRREFTKLAGITLLSPSLFAGEKKLPQWKTFRKQQPLLKLVLLKRGRGDVVLARTGLVNNLGYILGIAYKCTYLNIKDESSMAEMNPTFVAKCLQDDFCKVELDHQWMYAEDLKPFATSLTDSKPPYQQKFLLFDKTHHPYLEPNCTFTKIGIKHSSDDNFITNNKVHYQYRAIHPSVDPVFNTREFVNGIPLAYDYNYSWVIIPE